MCVSVYVVNNLQGVFGKFIGNSCYYSQLVVLLGCKNWEGILMYERGSIDSFCSVYVFAR